jgi:exonuclease VII small subunit
MKKQSQGSTKHASAPSFKEAYQTLSRVATTLETMQEPDLDQVVPLMAEAANAYDVCQARIKAVESILKERGWLVTEEDGVKST